jgi:hypothetical protein
MGHRNLNSAKKAKNDEFYTQLGDIENELKHYKNHLKGKVVFCNCDDPEWSNFWQYFYLNFDFLGLKALISTHFEKDKPSYKLECRGAKDKEGKLITEITQLSQNGDFRSPEAIEVLKESDVVVTNPPFSLFREYVAQLVEYDKKFLILGNMNSVTYKEIFPLIKNNNLWLGISPRGMDFRRPDDSIVSVNSVWFTNLPHSKRNEELILYQTYEGSEDNYPKYDNYDAINVDKTKEIPMDYEGYMGVPITFLDKFNPSQFEIIALGIVGSIEFSKNTKMEILDKNGLTTGKFTVNAKGTLYRKYNPKTDKKAARFKDVSTGELYSSIYARIIIKRK